MRDAALMLFALEASRPFAEKVSRGLKLDLSPHEEREFEDGEHKARPLVNVRNRHVYVIHSLYGEPGATANDKLCRLLFFIGALKDAAAASVTAITPYLCYARKDRKTKPRDPVTTRYVAALFEAVGTDRIVAIDVHNLMAYQNAFRCRTEHLEATSCSSTILRGLPARRISSSSLRIPAGSSGPSSCRQPSAAGWDGPWEPPSLKSTAPAASCGARR